jgi:hypothetical protein
MYFCHPLQCTAHNAYSTAHIVLHRVRIAHCALLCTMHYNALCMVHCAVVHSAQCSTICTILYALRAVLYALCAVLYALCAVRNTICKVRNTICTVRTTICNVRSTICIVLLLVSFSPFNSPLSRDYYILVSFIVRFTRFSPLVILD